MNWLQHHIGIVCMTFGLFAAIFVFVSWGVGYYCNAIYGMHFELSSCWMGVSAIGIGLVGLFKWLVDSSPWNSNEGKPPIGGNLK